MIILIKHLHIDASPKRIVELLKLDKAKCDICPLVSEIFTFDTILKVTF
jgi:hypothetical protein